MNKSLIILLTFLTLSGCDRVSKDLAQAPKNNQIGRYGLDHIKLNLPSKIVLNKLNSTLKTTLACKQKKVALGKIKRNFSLKNCELPKQSKNHKLWGEKLEALRLDFLDDKLISLDIKLKTSEGYEALYNKHGKHILNLLGKPAVIDLAYVQWKKQDDEATLEDKGQGAVHLLIQNKKAQNALHKTK